MGIIRDFKTIPELFYIVTQEFGKTQNKPAFKYKVNRQYTGISYSEVARQVEEFALGLASLGIKRGDNVAIISENRPEWVYADLAILAIGGIDVPLYPILTADNIEFILNNSESKCIVVSNKFQLNKVLKVRDKCKSLASIVVLNDIDEEFTNVYSFSNVKAMGKEFGKQNENFFWDSIKLAKEDDVATIIYTSGTTGEPKGVVLTHKNICSNAKGAHEAYNIGETDTFLSFLPLCHIFERTTGYYAAFAGGCIIAYAESIEKIATNMVEIKPTLMTAVPRLFERMYSRIMKNVESQPEKKQKIFNWAVETGRQYAQAERPGQAGAPLGLKIKKKLADKLALSKLKAITGGNLRFIVSGGAALARDLGEFFEAVGIKILEGYGLTESSPVLACNRENNFKFGTVGPVYPGVEIKIAKDGEILAYGPNIMQGYYKNKKETDAVLKDGWLHTGDIGVFDADGFLVITDRKKHLFKTTGGKYVAPTPIENMFLGSKYIEQFVLIGDRRMFLSALIVPDFEALKEFADANRISYNDVNELVQKKQIYELLEKDLSYFQKNLANFERVRKFKLLDKPFTIEDGELTPKLSVKRKVIEERYGNLIDEMYEA